MRLVDPGSDLRSWRLAARHLIEEHVDPTQVVWSNTSSENWLFPEPHQASVTAPVATNLSGDTFRVPKAFLELARLVICHQDPQRHSLLYTILWRIVRGHERHLLTHVSDDDVRRAQMMAKAVRREIHKTHAFVRFQKLGKTDSGREIFVAWFEPEHHIIELAAPFFRDRFSNMDWSILTPKGCAHWIQESLIFTEAIDANPFPESDALEDLWKCYYASIFNPARLKLKMMQSEMPKKYWKNLPEAQLIPSLSAASQQRVEKMFLVPERPPREIKNHPYLEQLKALPKE